MGHLESYNMIEAFNLFDLVTAVNAAIRDGWELHGSTKIILWKNPIPELESMTPYSGSKSESQVFYQAMVKIRKEKGSI